jgi:hypothetical protein
MLRDKVANAMAATPATPAAPAVTGATAGSVGSGASGPVMGVGAMKPGGTGAKSFSEGGIIDRPSKIIAGQNGPEVIIPIKPEYMEMTLRQIMEGMEQRKIEEDAEHEMAQEKPESIVDTSPAAQELGPAKTASLKSKIEEFKKEAGVKGKNRKLSTMIKGIENGIS